MRKNVKTEGEKIWGKNFRKATTADPGGSKGGLRGQKLLLFCRFCLQFVIFPLLYGIISAILSHFEPKKLQSVSGLPAPPFPLSLYFVKISYFFKLS